MYILGISCYYHDSAACLLKEGELIAAAQEERFTGIKHDFSFPYNAIRFCLEYGHIEAKNLHFVVFHEDPFLKLERIIKTVFSTYPKSYKLFNEVAKNWLKDKLWIKATIEESLDISKDKILFCKHHLSHAASSFFCSPFKQAAVLTCDGVGEWATTTLGAGTANWGGTNKNGIKMLGETRFPHSLGLLYSVFTAFLGFKINNGEYKVMGMSSFGEPKYTDKIYQLIKVKPDGSFKLDLSYFSFHYSTTSSFNQKFITLFGKPRSPDARFVLDKCDSNDTVTPKEIKENQRFADIAASIQKVSEDILIKIANYLYQKTKLNKLCLAGGVALNCVVNYRLLKETPFNDIFIQPNAGDGGGALGAALYGWHALLDKPRGFVLNHSYWGKEYDSGQIKNFLQKQGVSYEEFNEDDLINYVVKSLIDQKIVGWFQGRAEWGPRALGHRSILADPRDRKMKDKVNLSIKFREPFRPFAASVLYEHAGALFASDDIKDQSPFRFMLYALPLANNLIPAAAHIDGTSRPQFVRQDSVRLFHKLINKFFQKTGIPAILDTSFNLKGRPIVNSPAEAYDTFNKSGMDLLVMDKFLVRK
jgi:carbamoyltransferase